MLLTDKSNPVKSIIQLSKKESVIGIKDAGNKEKMERIKSGIHRDDFYFYAGGEMKLEEKVSYGYNRLSSIAGNIAPFDISQWFNKLLTKQQLNSQENEKIELTMEQVYQGNAIANLKKIINQKGVPIGICRSPIGSRE